MSTDLIQCRLAAFICQLEAHAPVLWKERNGKTETLVGWKDAELGIDNTTVFWVDRIRELHKGYQPTDTLQLLNKSNTI